MPDTEPLRGYMGETLTTGFDFATVPLAPSENLVQTNTRGNAEVVINDSSGNPVAGGVLAGPTIKGTQIVATISLDTAGPGTYMMHIWGPTSDQNRYLGRRTIKWV